MARSVIHSQRIRIKTGFGSRKRPDAAVHIELMDQLVQEFEKFCPKNFGIERSPTESRYRQVSSLKFELNVSKRLLEPASGTLRRNGNSLGPASGTMSRMEISLLDR